MRLELKNVGKIEHADIKLDGITVIAGENNTGKSTVSKMLFCLFSSFYKIEEQVNSERVKTISRVISNYYHEMTSRLTRGIPSTELARYIVENSKKYRSDNALLEGELKELFLKADRNLEKYFDSEMFAQIAQKINSFLQVEDDEIRKVILKKRLDAEFAMKVGHLNRLDEETAVHLSIKDGKIDFNVVKNEEIVLHHYMSLIKDIIYIDDPFILDNLSTRVPYRFVNLQHNAALLSKIAFRDTDRDFGVLDELVVKQKFDRIFAAMNDVCDGELSANDVGTYEYKTQKLDGTLEMVNLSTGMKSFVILRELLQNGSIDENGVVILDEPEIHLHPEWQLKFAEVIVLIQKEFGTNILLNTHSPYFLNAIEAYSQKYGIEEACKFYLTDEKDMRTNIIDVTGKTERIYEKLARPLQELENLEKSPMQNELHG